MAQKQVNLFVPTVYLTPQGQKTVPAGKQTIDDSWQLSPFQNMSSSAPTSAPTPPPTSAPTPGPGVTTSIYATPNMFSDPYASMKPKPAAPAPAPAPTPTPAPVPSYKPQPTAQAPRPAAPSAPMPQASTGSPVPTVPGVGTSGAVDPIAMWQVMNAIQSKVTSNNSLMDTRNLILKSLYDHPLTPEERAKLDPAILKAIDSGDRRLIDMNMRLISDQIQGRTKTLDSSMQFLVTSYNDQIKNAESQKQQAIDNVMNVVDKFGSNAKQALTSLYGQSYVDSLKQYGIDLDSLTAVPKTVEQQRYEAQYGTGSGSGYLVSIPQNIGSQQNQLAYRNNNPGNLRFANQEGATMGASGFAKFSSPEAGFNALIQDLQYKQSGSSKNNIPDGPHAGQRLTGDSTLEDMMRVYAPTGDRNAPVAYAAAVAANLGIPVTTPINQIDTADLAAQIAQHESGTTITQNKSDIQEIAAAIMSGDQPPVLTGLYGKSAAVKAELARNGFDLAHAQQEWNAANRWITTMNGSQMVRFNGLATSVMNTIDEVKGLADQMKLGGIPIVNKAQLAAIIQTQGNTPQGQLASQYLAAVNTLKEEFANLANGGYAPTEAAWGLANSQINANYGIDQLGASLDEVRRLIGYRVNAIQGTQPAVPGGSSSGTADDILSQYGL